MLVNIIEYTSVLGTAYYFTRKERYAQRAARMLRTFFLDATTGMLPSLKYAAMVPDVSEVGAPTVRLCPVLHQLPCCSALTALLPAPAAAAMLCSCMPLAACG
jgi:Alginate lyase